MKAIEKLREYADATKWGGECRILHAHNGDFAGDCSERECNECRAAYLQAIADEIERDRADSPKVLDADGEPLEVGQTVYTLNDDRPYTVKKVETNRVSVNAGEGAYDVWRSPTYLTHHRPVLDADGVPIKKGDTVYVAPFDDPLTVRGFAADGRVLMDYHSDDSFGYSPENLTHAKPEPPDAWERIEEDVMVDAIDYCEAHGIKTGYSKHCGKAKCEDLVRRCKALAEKESSNE